MNTRHGWMGLFYKNSLPVIVRNDLSLDESIVVELKLGRKNILYCSISIFCQTSRLYIQKLILKIRLQYLLQAILMHTLSFGGLMVTQLQKEEKSKDFL